MGVNVEAIIEEAMRRGDFDNLPKGKAVDLTGYFATPEDLRLGYSILKNAGFIPPEAEMLDEIARLEGQIHSTRDEGAVAALRRRLEEVKLKTNLWRESRRR